MISYRLKFDSKVFWKCIFISLALAGWNTFAGENAVLVRLSSPPITLYKSNAQSTGFDQLDRSLGLLGAQSVRPAVQHSGDLPEKYPEEAAVFRWIKVVLPIHVDMNQAIAELRDQPGVELVQANRAFRLHWQPNDPKLGQQWALEKIKAFSAWDLQRGKKDVLVAVIDTGVEYEHPDLADNIWINPGEDLNRNGAADQADINGNDDDGNGFIDDLLGWDFTDAPNYPDGGDYLGRDRNPEDEMGHGTAVAGIIAAVANNNEGMAGLANGCRIMNLRAFTANGFGEEDDVASAIVYAIENQARIINMSWGDVFVSRILDDVVKYAASKNVVMVASCGNSSTEQIHYPSAFTSTISVASSEKDDQLSSFSNYGPTVDLVAPGEGILSTTIEGKYDSTLNGTSFAAPFVSAAAALIISQDKSIASEAVRNILTATADDLGSKGWDRYFGAGRLNIFKALSRPAGAVVEITDPWLDQGFNKGPIEIRGSAWSPAFEGYSLQYGLGDNPDKWHEIPTTDKHRVIDGLLAVWQDIPDQDSSCTVRLVVSNRDGSVLTSAVRIFIDKTPPVLSQVELLPMLDGPDASVLIQFGTDDLSETSVFYRPQASAAPFEEAVMSFRTREPRLNFGQNRAKGTVEVKLQARNGAGLVTDDDNGGMYYMLDLGQPPISLNRYTFANYSLPHGHLINAAPDFNNNGVPELVVGSYEDYPFIKTRLYEFAGAGFQAIYETERQVIPRSVGDTNHNGRLELLCGYGFSSYLYESPAPGQTPTVELKTWEGDGAQQFWASRIADIDGDMFGEIIMRVVKSGGHDQFEIWKNSADNRFSLWAELPNPTVGSNMNGVPHSVVGDFDGDSFNDILLGDSDGDIYIYEFNGSTFTAVWQDRLPLQDAISFLSAGDYDGDGAEEFIAGCHSDPNLNTEHYYDARHWLYRVYDRTADNVYEKVAEWRFFGFESIKDFESGVTSGDVDMDKRDEILICAFPDFYLIDYDDDKGYEVSFYASPVRSNDAICIDADGDSITEFWVSDGEYTRAYTLVDAQSGPAVPVGLEAQPLGEREVRIKWFPVTGVNGYQIYRGATTDTLMTLTITNRAEYVDRTVTPGAEYWYAVASLRGPDISRRSVPVRVKPGSRPFVEAAYMENEYSLRLRFSEIMSDRIKDPANYFIDGGVGRPSSCTHHASGGEAILSLYTPFTREGGYTVRTYNLQDIDGTPMDSLRNYAEFQISFKQKPPYLLDYRFINSRSIELIFSEPMEVASIQEPSHYDFGEKIDVSSATVSAGSNDRVKLQITTDETFGALGKSYTLRVRDVKSAAGIPLVPGRGDMLQLIFSRANLSDVFTYPNPFRYGPDGEWLTFANLTREAEIRIMTLDGYYVRTLYEDNGDGGVRWDARDENGNVVASGVYIYRIIAGAEIKMGKLAIVR